MHLLGELVGDVIREQGGDELFDLVESARQMAITLRESRTKSTSSLRELFRESDATLSAEVVRAFSTYFQVVNLAERVHRVRRGRAKLREKDEAPSGSLRDAVRTLGELGLTGTEIAAAFSDSVVEPVFTAHPTEATRRIILEKQERIAEELIARLNPDRTPYEERTALARIRENVTTAWQTDEHPSVRPTVADEREHILYYVAGVLYAIVPALHERLDDALGETRGSESSAPLLRVASWVGGDMDGNPNVDAGTIRDTLRRHREIVLEKYADETNSLARQLSQSPARVGYSDEVVALRRRYEERFPTEAGSLPPRHLAMTYRVTLSLIATRLEATGRGEPVGYEGPREFEEELVTVARSLEQHRGGHAGLFRVRRLQRRVATFGFHLAALDVRQDARELRDVVSTLVGDPEWPTRSSGERAERLRSLLVGTSEAPTPDRSDTRVVATLDVFRAIDECRREYGPGAIRSYIISMAQDVDDVLTVFWLASLAGVDLRDGGVTVVPLFETVRDLERSADVLRALAADPIVSESLAARDGRQMVMVGYSDSNKDGGITAARWALHSALEEMAGAARDEGMTLTVFHGRGGTVSRGGGLVHRAVAAMPPGAIGGRLRLTEQGEVIHAKYGLRPIALRNLERMLGAIVLRASSEDVDATPESWRSVGQLSATEARAEYRRLVYEDDRFTSYFRAGTPIDVIERLAIGSRPASRRAGAGVEDLRAIPWVFAWSQCRAMITGWYGLGTGLRAARQAYGLELLSEVASNWPYFDVLLSDVEMVLAKSDLRIAEMYSRLVQPEARGVFDEIRSEFDRTEEEILTIRGSTSLLDSQPTLQRSIRLRNPYIDPMSVLQVELLERWRNDGRSEGALFDALLSSVTGIARGLLNTG